MYTLYSSPGSCSMALRALLNELDLPYTSINAQDTSSPRNRTEDYLKTNKMGTVPALEIDGRLMLENAAIAITLFERHADKIKNNFLPSNPAEKAEALQWLMFCNSTLHPTYSRAFFGRRSFADDAETSKKVIDKTFAIIQKIWDRVEDRLNQSPFLGGKNITYADFYLTTIANWTYKFEPLMVNFGDKTKALFKTVIAHPSYAKALEQDGIKHNAV